MGLAAPTVLDSNVMSTVGTTTTTASVTPNAAGVQFIYVYAHRAGGAVNITGIVGNSRTWTRIKQLQTAILSNEDLEVWAGYGAAPTAGTIVITVANTVTNGRYAVVQQTLMNDANNPDSGISASNSGTGTTGTVTLATDSPGGRRFSVFGHRVAEATAPDVTGVTHTELHDATTTTCALEIQYTDGYDDTNTATWATSSGWSGIAFVADPGEAEGTFMTDDDDFSFQDTGVASLEVTLLEESGEEDESGTEQGVWAIVGGPNP